MRLNSLRWSRRGSLPAWVLLSVSFAAAAVGCQNIMWRGQNADDGGSKLGGKSGSEATKYVGDATAVWGLNYAKIEGIALVTQLDDSGSDPPPSKQRDDLVKEMQTHNVQNAAEILKSKTTSMAIVAANLPPGIQKGERFDVFVTTMPKSETTSLRGGFVMQTWMRSKAFLEGKVKEGHDAALVKGRIQVRAFFESGDDPMLENSGYILGGGVALEDREMGLALRDEFATLQTAVAISRAINARFTTYDETGKIGASEPKNNRSIVLLVPEEYRHNVGRFVRLVVNIAYHETPEERLNRMEQLERELNEPALAQQAALRLEAIGREAIPTLKRSLRSDDSEIRFYAAEALAYLDQPDGIEELKAAAENEPDFRWHALTALASSHELDAGIALTDLFHNENAETRYGAFRAMFARSPQDPMMAGDWMGGEYFLHVVPTTGSTLIHFSMQNRAEIVVFGGAVPVSDDFVYIENGLTVQAQGNGVVQLTRFLPGKGESKLKSSNSVADVIRMMAQAGCSYDTMMAMCKDAQKSNTLNCKMVVNRVPKSERLYSHGESLSKSRSEESRKESFPSESIPTMFDEAPDATAPSPESHYPAEAESAKSKKNVFATMKSWFTTQ